MNAAERHHVDKVSTLRCVVGQRFGHCEGALHIHHIAEGSGLRSWFAIAPLCWGHHEGPAGLHGMGTKKFIMLYRPFGDSEFGLLDWVNEDMAKMDAA